MRIGKPVKGLGMATLRFDIIPEGLRIPTICFGFVFKGLEMLTTRFGILPEGLGASAMLFGIISKSSGGNNTYIFHLNHR